MAYDYDKKAKDEQKARQVEAIEQAVLQMRLNDLRWLLGNPQGRRLWTFLVELTRYNAPNCTGNSKEYTFNGMRQVMIELNNFADLLGLDGLDMRHAAEREYAMFMAELKARLEVPEPQRAERKGTRVEPL